MPLSSMKSLLEKAAQKSYAVGAFSVINLETVYGAVLAAEEMQSPVILQIAEPRLRHAPLEYIGPLMVSAAKNAGVPVAVHLDHGESLSTIKKAIKLGFTSVMIDASRLPLDENIRLTAQVCREAHASGVECEGEVGCLGNNEENTVNFAAMYTNVHEAELFASETGVDALAVAIGNKHGLHAAAPALDFTRLRDIHVKVTTPLVLHGGTGISDENFKKCVALGIRKINIATATVHDVMLQAKRFFDEYKNVGGGDYYSYQDMVVNAAKETVKHHILTFGSDGMA